MRSRRTSRALRWAPLALMLSFSAPGLAHAAPGDSERMAAAQALFDEARGLTERGDYAAACPKLAESRRLDPTMGTTFYLADCLQHVGKLASAWSYYIEVADAARAAGQQDRESFARERAAALKPRLPALIVAVPPEVRTLAALEITRNGIPLGEAQWGAAIPVDLGEHVVVATARGKRRWEARVSVTDEGKSVTLDVPALEDAPVPVAPTPPRATAPLRPAEPPPPPRVSGQRIAGVALGAAGVVGVGIGAIFGLQAMAKQRESNEGGRCDADGYCDDEGLALRKDAISAATISTIGFIAGGVALAGGAVLFFTAKSGEPARTSAAGPGAAPAAGARMTTTVSAPRAHVVVGPGGFSFIAEF